MNLAENIRVALQGLGANKLRSALTMLGVIIGVLAVILGTAIGQGSRQQVLARIQSLGSNVITIYPGEQRSGAVRMGIGSSQTMKLEDVDAIRRECPSVVNAAPRIRSSAQVKFGNRNTNTSIIGTTPEYFAIRNYHLERGHAFTQRDVKGMRKVGLVGKTAAQNLFGDSAPLGKSLRIRGIRFRIVGLMGLVGGEAFGDPDDQIYIPITTGMKMVFGQDYIERIYAQAASMEKTAQAVAEIETALRKAHRLPPSKNSDFSVRTQAEYMETQEAAAQTFTLLLTGIAATSLLVGGIGIMNIMLVSVTERTREIGLRKAVGAKNANILFQFLIESMTLSLFGGLIGIGAGFLVSKGVGTWLGWLTIISPMWVGVAFVSSATIGIVFGVYPAWKAAQLSPIEALRYE